jgi:hypothetical protein
MDWPPPRQDPECSSTTSRTDGGHSAGAAIAAVAWSDSTDTTSTSPRPPSPWRIQARPHAHAGPKLQDATAAGDARGEHGQQFAHLRFAGSREARLPRPGQGRADTGAKRGGQVGMLTRCHRAGGYRRSVAGGGFLVPRGERAELIAFGVRDACSGRLRLLLERMSSVSGGTITPSDIACPDSVFGCPAPASVTHRWLQPQHRICSLLPARARVIECSSRLRACLESCTAGKR